MSIYKENNDFATSEEYHYFFVCKENTLIERRDFKKKILNIDVNFRNFDYKTLFYYVLSLHDVPFLM